MLYYHQFDYIFAIAMIFAFLDAFNIGANDVANSFSSSVSSRSLKYWQAMVLAAIMEFLGAVLVGNRVSDTVRKKIIKTDTFENDPTVLMLAMAMALVGSSIWLSIATSIGMPVSTSHSIIGAVIGVGIASKGADHVKWGWDGFSQIVASWFIAPAIAGAFASVMFLFVKFTVLEVKDNRKGLRNGLFLVPALVFVTFAVLTMLIVWKGSPKLKLDDLSTGATVGAIFGVGASAFIVYMVFIFPVVKRRIYYQDWRIKWYDVFRGPVYWFKSTDDIPPLPAGQTLTIDYYEGRRVEDHIPIVDEETKDDAVDETKHSISRSDVAVASIPEKKQKTSEYWLSLLKAGPSKWPLLLWLMVSHGFTKDVISDQVNSEGALGHGVKNMHAKSKFYDNNIEYLFSLLQAITACTMSFAHGANDIANASGPLSTVYLVWSDHSLKATPPIWILIYTAGALVIGCWMFGYKIMGVLGNKMILQSPSRGFAIEFGAAITVVMATQLAIPVSTTQCAVGATVFVGLCNQDIRGVNWRMVTWCYLGWFITLPVAGIISGVITGIILNAPRLGVDYVPSS
ncbi:CIC11C00000004255 [Sungouiella intermedia]|uniref:Phosphate transporter n=1 Tax=Sungouiella intermedia TaxID=45354 RepID=A0A1L0BP80_9ASCO|nr:CIC11C00000004255 [[Candida] intermedia]